MVIASSAAWGSISDKIGMLVSVSFSFIIFIGRRIVYAAGFLVMAMALFLYPFPRTFALLVVLRLLFAAGAASAASMTSAGAQLDLSSLWLCAIYDYALLAQRFLPLCTEQINLTG
jgi:MFS family permease